jgi:hypothetical protein
MCTCIYIRKYSAIEPNFRDDDIQYLLRCCAVGSLKETALQSLPSEARVTPVELSIKRVLSPSVNLETAQQERSMLLSGDKRLLREGNGVDLLCIGGYSYRLANTSVLVDRELVVSNKSMIFPDHSLKACLLTYSPHQPIYHVSVGVLLTRFYS